MSGQVSRDPKILISRETRILRISLLRKFTSLTTCEDHPAERPLGFPRVPHGLGNPAESAPFAETPQILHPYLP